MSEFKLLLFKILESKLLFTLVIRNLDIFGQSITLNINKQKSYSTIFGGVSSILIITILIGFFQSNILSFFNKQQVVFSTDTEFSPSPDNIVMNIQNYMAAFSIEQDKYAINPFFNITVEQRYYYRNDQGQLIKNTTILQLEPCTLQHFELLLNQPGLNFSSQFDELDLENWLCPKKDFQFSLQGTYTSTEFEYIRIIVDDCKDQKGGYENWKPTCATQEQRDAHLSDQGQFKLSIYQVNSVVNPHSSSNYIQTYLDGEMYFTFVPKKLSRQANLFYRKYQFYNDLSLLPIEDIEEKQLIVRQSEDFRDLTEIGRDTDSNYAIIYLRRSQFTESIDRRFVKIDELLSFLGGFLQIMIAGFGIIIIYYNKLSMQVALSNKLYNFSQNEIKQNKINQTLDSSMLNESKVQLQTDQGAVKSQLIHDQNDMIQTILNSFEKSNKITLTFKRLINHLSFGLFFNDQDSQVFQRAIEQVDADLDIHDILFRIQEISKLKLVLFKRQQHVLFNFTPKPILTQQMDEQIPNRLSLEQQPSTSDQNWRQQKRKVISQFYDAWKEVKYDSSLNTCQQDLNFNLNFELGAEIQQIFTNMDKFKVHETLSLEQQQNQLQTIVNE